MASFYEGSDLSVFFPLRRRVKRVKRPFLILGLNQSVFVVVVKRVLWLLSMLVVGFLVVGYVLALSPASESGAF